MKKLLYIFTACLFLMQIISCKTTTTIESIREQIKEDNEKFLNPDKKASEVFRVLLTSDEYRVIQLKSDKTPARSRNSI